MKDNLLIRLAVAVISIPLIFVLTLKGGLPFLMFVEILLVSGMLEFCRIAETKQASIYKFPFVLLGVFFPVCAYFWRETGVLFLIILSLAASGFILVIAGKTQQGLLRASSFALGMLYIPCGLAFVVMLRQLPVWSGQNPGIGALWVIFVLLAIWSCDTCAYAVGRLVGRHPLSEAISPRKTWEGAIAGFLGANLVTPLFHFLLFKEAPWVHMFIISAVIGTLGQVGDLLESLLKRDADLKDASGLIPGHGGMLDRFDSLLFVSPLIYFYLRFTVYG